MLKYITIFVPVVLEKFIFHPKTSSSVKEDLIRIKLSKSNNFNSGNLVGRALKSQNLTGIVPPEFSKLRHLKVL
jgi:hypothetical protein